MGLRHLIRKVLAVGGAVGLFSLAGPGGSFAAAPAATPPPPPRIITITITDAGFDAQSYTVGHSNGTPADEGQAVVVNSGKFVHSVTMTPGQGSQNYVTIGQQIDGSGNAKNCYYASNRCGKQGVLDTGGIEPGGRVQLGFTLAPQTFIFTSYPDCLAGDRPSNGSFNCSPVTLKTVPIGGSSPIAGTYAGSGLAAAGSPDCLGIMTPVAGAPELCYTPSRRYSTTRGSVANPVGDTTVTIDDVRGFQPTILYVKAGSRVTWVNQGQRVHSAALKGGTIPWGFLNSGGLAPGESFSRTFAGYGCHVEQAGSYPGGCGFGMAYQSNVLSDLIPNKAAGGFGVGFSGNCRSGPCGQSAMIGKLMVVGS